MKPETVQVKGVTAWPSAGLAAWLVVACLGAAGRTAAEQAVPPRPAEVAARASASREAADTDDPQKLPVIADLDLSNATLAESLDRIRDASGANLVVRWPVLKAAGVDPDKPVRMRMWDTRVSDALDMVLLRAVGEKSGVVWRLREGVVVVSTTEDLSDRHTKSFDVRDLVRGFRDASREQDEALTWSAAEGEVVRLVTEMVDPGSWRDAGGNVGAIRMTRRRLVVTQSAEGMRKVEAFLDHLRRELHEPPPATRPATPPAPTEDKGSGSGAVILREARKIEELNLPNSTLEDAVERLSAVTDVQITVNWRAVENAGVDRHATVSLHLRNITLGEALADMFAGAGGGVVAFRAWEHDDTVRVSTWDDVKPEPARFYDIRDLLRSIETTRKSGFRGPGGREGNRVDAGDEIVRMIVENVEPDSWRDAGGSHGAIRYNWGRLIVTQTPEGHRAVEKYLASLRHEFMKDDRPRDPTTAPSAPSTPSPRPAGG